MKTYKPQYQDKKTGKIKKCSKWHLNFRDNLQIRRRMECFTDKTATNELGVMINKLLEQNGLLTGDLHKWFMGLRPEIRNRIIKFGLVRNQQAIQHIDKKLSEHLQDFYKSLLIRSGKKHADCEKNQLQNIFDKCGFDFITDIDSNAIDTYLGKRLKDDEISQRTFNCYLKYVKQFFTWLTNEGRTVNNPVNHLKTIEETKKKRNRRAIQLQDLIHLLETVRASEEIRYGMTGEERFFLYVLACQTGMRGSDLRRLKVGDFDIENLCVTVKASCSKNKKEKTLPIKQSTAEALKEYFKGKLPTVRAFGGTYKQLTERTADMLKEDLADTAVKDKAGNIIKKAIPYIDEKGREFDFHSLRKEAGTLMNKFGVKGKTAQSILRHSSIDLTMNIYTDSFKDDEVEAVEKLPDFVGNQKKVGA